MKIHIIRPGDRIAALAQRYNIPVARLLEANPQIKDLEKLELNEKIRIPTGRIPLPSAKEMEQCPQAPVQSTVSPQSAEEATRVELAPVADMNSMEELADPIEYAPPYFSMFADSSEYDESTSYPSFDDMGAFESSTFFESALQGMEEGDNLPVPPMSWYPPFPQGYPSHLPFPPLFGPIGWIAASSPFFAGPIGWHSPPFWAGQPPHRVASQWWERESSSR
jgi:LysM repeat protein